ncbi:MAG: hypothetical protein IID03_12615 [Candidatus Dadabacteria bacterium]|nr:hypothetical protein [Candidatus Dadabacteria bacterium]
MEKLVYLILSRDMDKFSITYIGDCDKTDDQNFFTQNSNFKCWVRQSDSEKSLYLAILPMFESSNDQRRSVFNKIITHYKPPCNSEGIHESKLDYVVQKTNSLEV